MVMLAPLVRVASPTRRQKSFPLRLWKPRGTRPLIFSRPASGSDSHGWSKASRQALIAKHAINTVAYDYRRVVWKVLYQVAP